MTRLILESLAFLAGLAGLLGLVTVAYAAIHII